MMTPIFNDYSVHGQNNYTTKVDTQMKWRSGKTAGRNDVTDIRDTTERPQQAERIPLDELRKLSKKKLK